MDFAGDLGRAFENLDDSDELIHDIDSDDDLIHEHLDSDGSHSSGYSSADDHGINLPPIPLPPLRDLPDSEEEDNGYADIERDSSPISVRSQTFSESRSASEAPSSASTDSLASRDSIDSLVSRDSIASVDSIDSNGSLASLDSLFVDQRPERHGDAEEDALRQEDLSIREQIEQGALRLRELGERIRRNSEALQQQGRRFHPYMSQLNRRRNPAQRVAYEEEDLFDDYLEALLVDEELVEMDDELVEMELAQPRHGRSIRSQSLNQAPRQRTPPAVIDLTEEPDSPEDVVVISNHHRRNPQQRSGRPANPRRQPSQNNRAPPLARSDGSILGAPIIDLTGMDDDAPSPPPQIVLPLPPVNNLGGRDPRHRAQPRPASIPPIREAINLLDEDNNGGRSFLNAAQQALGNLGHLGNLFAGGNPMRIHQLMQEGYEVHQIGGNNRAHADRHPNPNPLQGNIPNFNYRANGYNNAPAKPKYVPPPPPKEGFTRDTGSDVEAICPGCLEELAYDADDDESPPSKKARTRKDREVHHFWAVKDCGHVFCRACFETRRPTSKNNSKFELREKKVICAVPGCEADVTSKAAWVGIFL